MVKLSLELLLRADIDVYLQWYFHENTRKWFRQLDVDDGLSVQEGINIFTKLFKHIRARHPKWTANKNDFHQLVFAQTRLQSFLREAAQYEEKIDGNPLHLNDFREIEFLRIIDEDKNGIVDRILRKEFVPDMFALAVACGKVEYLKAIGSDLEQTALNLTTHVNPGEPAKEASQKSTVIDEYDLVIEKHIGCFKGKKNGYGLMDKQTYDYVFELTKILVYTRKVPKNIKPIQNVGMLPFKFINRTYYNLHREVEGRRINDGWVYFLFKLFGNYTSMEMENIKKGFSRYDGGNYEYDKQTITDY